MKPEQQAEDPGNLLCSSQGEFTNSGNVFNCPSLTKRKENSLMATQTKSDTSRSIMLLLRAQTTGIKIQAPKTNIL